MLSDFFSQPNSPDLVTAPPRGLEKLQSELSNETDSVARLVFVGDGRVGTSAVIRCLTGRGAFDENYRPEVAKVVRHTKKVTSAAHGTDVMVQFWDVEGGDSQTALFCAAKAHAVTVVYDVTNRSSFEKAQRLLQAINPRASALLVGNKVDLAEAGLRKVSFKEGKLLAKIHRVHFTEVSAKLNHNVDEVLRMLVASVPEEYLLVKGKRQSRGSTSATTPPPLCAVCKKRVKSHHGGDGHRSHTESECGTASSRCHGNVRGGHAVQRRPRSDQGSPVVGHRSSYSDQMSPASDQRFSYSDHYGSPGGYRRSQSSIEQRKSVGSPRLPQGLHKSIVDLRGSPRGSKVTMAHSGVVGGTSSGYRGSLNNVHDQITVRDLSEAQHGHAGSLNDLYLKRGGVGSPSAGSRGIPIERQALLVSPYGRLSSNGSDRSPYGTLSSSGSSDMNKYGSLKSDLDDGIMYESFSPLAEKMEVIVVDKDLKDRKDRVKAKNEFQPQHRARTLGEVRNHSETDVRHIKTKHKEMSANARPFDEARNSSYDNIKSYARETEFSKPQKVDREMYGPDVRPKENLPIKRLDRTHSSQDVPHVRASPEFTDVHQPALSSSYHEEWIVGSRSPSEYRARGKLRPQSYHVHSERIDPRHERSRPRSYYANQDIETDISHSQRHTGRGEYYISSSPNPKRGQERRHVANRQFDYEDTKETYSGPVKTQYGRDHP